MIQNRPKPAGFGRDGQRTGLPLKKRQPLFLCEKRFELRS